ncbi:GNAT family N-acetyltransferase [Furfurilactobacillus siliginis]|uniref:N-acetyltransferase n=1 Tax=Furfurilactobacillus siliginis TaxID=348151 RepID=A0A0R2L587_9LACO|nr:GNAT family N-acetyltransferase [Furfurilactobacillus siliginis]KRN93991.1 hypothetical protein IV55_GL000652 [Furfurilactobacillus siliginis]GEK29590.1 N-acetyltransferase [Furfurilactobacillus siliginis]
MQPLQIRTATLADYPSLEKIYLEARRESFPWVINPQLTDFERDSHHETILVALQNNQAVGFLSFYRLANFIHLLFVDPNHQHEHVGTQLITAIRQVATGPLQLKVVTENEAAQKFYAQLGFREIKRDLLARPTNITLEDTALAHYPFLGKRK